jgi:hypothetical protein
VTKQFDQQYGYGSGAQTHDEHLDLHDQVAEELDQNTDRTSGTNSDYDAVRVEVINTGTTTGVQAGIYQTVVIPASSATVTSVMPVVGRDQERQYARLMAIDGPVVIATTLQMAQSSANIGTATTPTTPSVPATTVAAQNTSANAVQVVITGGTVTTILVNGINVGSGDGTYAVPGYGSIAVTYSGLPTWAWTYQTPGLTLASPQGIYLIAGSLSDSIHHNEPVWAANPSQTASCRVAVYVERGDV